MAAESSLAWLLHPVPVEVFLDEIWARRHHHVPRGEPGYFDGLLPSAVDELLEQMRPEPSAVRLVKGGQDKDPASYRRGDGSLDPARARDGLADGYTIVLNGLERYSRAVAALSHSLEVELNFPTRVNAYVTPPDSTGFVPHYDPHDVLVLQIQGSKTWHASTDAPVPAHEIGSRKGVGTDEPSSATDVRLRAGDVLYLPRGQVHSAETHAEPSVHLTIGLHAPTVLTLVTHALYALSLRDPGLHTRLPPRHLDDAGVRAGLGDLVRDALRTLEGPELVADGLGALEDVLVRRGRCPPVGRVSDTVGIDAQTLVRKHQPLYARVTRVADRVVLQFAQLSVAAGLDHEAAMRFLVSSTEPFRVGELPGLSAPQRTGLAQTLLLNGFLARLSND
ncbi:cupin domain-containing protein [Mycobacterium intracellulare]|uniref:cupin domain-containing protein n=1 Tax=Mycobacterium intracellulare TaxID=1767 RepID=UPI001EED2D92|nr:cupin domain-containing protein [Mycobacterium intracellulare]MEE3749938.1 cupin domain-containing protein [Mycobacterium intracellulare]